MTTPVPRLVWRARLAAASLVLVALTFVSQPGRIVGDTKADLVLAPGAFLDRALHLWDPAGSFGQVQNQAYGYLFPMGPFFWVGDVMTIDPWIVQRLWWSLVLVVAFLGIVKLSAALDVGTPTARIIGGFAYALSPRLLSVIGASSIEVWPAALAPWVLVPLVIGVRCGNARRHAALSALAVAAVGGVNAAATFAVIPLGVLWLLMAAPGARRRTLLTWWPAFVALGTLWWIGPLLLLGRYSPPFLDFIESATTTTFAATAFDALRGTSNWIAYLDGTQVAGNSLITNQTIIVNSTVVLVLGLWGVARRDNRANRFLVAGIALGLVLLTLGHAGTNIGTGPLQDLLDGVLAPLRNTHKFDPVVRIPLVLGLVHLVGVLSAGPVRTARTGRTARAPVGIVVLAGAALLGSTVPAWTGDLANRGSYTEVPGYWTEASQWLNEEAGAQNSLLLPGSAFGVYLWGSPRDEVVQSYLSSPWSVRNAVPLTPPGSIRALDAFERAFASGAGSTALRDQLVRSGIRHLVVRHDLASSATTDPELVHSTLRSTPGVELTRSFGPLVGSPASQETEDGELVFVNAGRQSRHRAIEIFTVADVDSTTARVQPSSGTPVVVGGPDAMLQQDGLFDRATDVLLAVDHGAGRPDGPVVLTDTDRRQEVAFGRVVDNRSASLARSDPYRIDRPVHDYDVAGADRWKTEPVLVGAERIAASSSASDVTEPTIDVARHPWAAFDDDMATRWVAGSRESRAWLEVELTEPVSVEGLSVQLSSGQPARRVVVTTDAGSAATTVLPGRSVELDSRVGLTRRLRVSAPSSGLEPLAIDDLTVPGVELTRPLRLPRLPAAWPAPEDIVLAAPAGPAVCRAVVTVTRCSAGRDGLGEDGRTIDRIVPTPSAATYAAGVSVVPQGSTALTDLLSGDVQLRASSTGSSAPTAGLLALIDGDPQTGWIAALRDVEPTISLTFDERRPVDRLVMTTDVTLAASAPRRARVVTDSGRTFTARFDPDGVARFPEVDTRSLRIRVTDAYVRSSLAFDGTGSGLPLGISEVRVPGSGLSLAADASDVVALPCGSGPGLEIDGRPHQTSLRVSRTGVLSRRPLGTSVCGTPGVRLGAGEHRVTASASAAFRPVTVRLSRTGQAPSTGVTVPTKRADGASIDVADLPGDGTRLVTLSQNVNGGWSAENARAVTVNGWQQGWVTDRREVDATFGPGRVFLAALVLGLLAAGGLAVSAWRLRGSPQTRTEARRTRTSLRAVVGTTAAVVATLLVGGAAGAALAVAAGVVVLVVGRRRDVSWLVPAGVLVAGLAYAMRPWTSADGWAGASSWPQWCVVASVAAAAASVFEREIRAFLSRMAGRSTTR